MDTSRRALLRSIGRAGVVAAGGGTATAGTASAQDLRKGAVIPEVDEFEGNYGGQWVELNEETSADGGPVDGCDAAEWEPENTQAYTGFLMDRRGGTEPIVELTVLTEAGEQGPQEDTTYIVNEATECGNGFVFLDLKIVRIRSVVNKPAGPGADGDGDGGGGGGGGGGGDSIPGFGAGVAALALAASALARAIRRDDR